MKRYFNIDRYAKPKQSFDIDIQIAFQSLHYYVSTLGWGDRLSALLMSLMALRLKPVEQNPFWPCFCCREGGGLM